MMQSCWINEEVLDMTPSLSSELYVQLGAFAQSLKKV